MFSSIPKRLDKNFVIGFFLPALLTIVATAWAFPNLMGFDPVRSLAASEKKLGDLTYLALMAWILAIVLMTSSHVQYRLLEGYLPPVKWLLPLRSWHRRRFRQVRCEYDQLIARWTNLIESKNAEAFSAQERRRATHLSLLLATRYPTTEDEVMATAFGNIIRSFEVYPRQVYGADGVSVWLRLASVIPKGFSALLDDARAQVDCFVNVTELAFVIALVSLVVAVSNADWEHGIFLGQAAQRHLAITVIGLVVAALSYWLAMARAMIWGNLVRSAFDCYLPALIKQLGFAIPPTDAERREFWGEFNALILYQRRMTVDRWPLIGGELAPQQEAAKIEFGEEVVKLELEDER